MTRRVGLTPDLVRQLARESSSQDLRVVVAALCHRLDPEGRGVKLSAEEIVDAVFAGSVKIMFYEGDVAILHIPRLSHEECWGGGAMNGPCDDPLDEAFVTANLDGPVTLSYWENGERREEKHATAEAAWAKLKTLPAFVQYTFQISGKPWEPPKDDPFALAAERMAQACARSIGDTERGGEK